jgi:hypothetical protein
VTDTEARNPAAVWGEAVERQLERLETRLIAEFDGGAIPATTVHLHVAAAREKYADARVWTYLPILIERYVRHRLHARLPQPGEQSPDTAGTLDLAPESWTLNPPHGH